jgi:hypothetical protein
MLMSERSPTPTDKHVHPEIGYTGTQIGVQMDPMLLVVIMICCMTAVGAAIFAATQGSKKNKDDQSEE